LNTSDLVLLAIFFESGFAIGIVAMAIANRRVDSSVRKARWKKLLYYCLITHIVAVSIVLDKRLFGLICAIIVGASTFEFLKAAHIVKTTHKRFYAILVASCIFGITVVGLMCFFYYGTTWQHLYVYLIIAVLDAYSQLCGQLWGRHALALKISPNKTIEGASGGLMAAVLTAIVFRHFVQLSVPAAVGVGVLLSLAGIFGDLGGSWFKRCGGIKDYSAHLPGQGGFLDRFNSLLAAAPVFLIVMATLAQTSRP
jgi:phosphatidate cytidylyltransferase